MFRLMIRVVGSVILALSFTCPVSAQSDGSVLPFPSPPSESVANPRIQDSTMKWPKPPQRLPADAP